MMTIPTPDVPAPLPATTTDPITAILLSVTRIEGNLAGALETLKRHDGQIEKHSETLQKHGDRLTALETRDKRDDQTQSRSISARAVLFSALGVAVSLLLAAIAFYAAIKA